MPVETIQSNVTYQGNGSTTTPYPFDFPTSDAQSMKVRVLPPGGEWATLPATEYTVTLVSGGADGGDVRTATAYAADTWVDIYRDTPLTQPYSYDGKSRFDTETHQEGLDRQALQIQELAREQGRALRIPDAHVALPGPEGRRGRHIRFQDDDDAFPQVFTDAQLASLIAPYLPDYVPGQGFATVVFADAAQRATVTPDGVGQLGVQLDDFSVWKANDLLPGSWVPLADDIPESTVLGRAAGAGTGQPEALTSQQARDAIGAAPETVASAENSPPVVAAHLSVFPGEWDADNLVVTSADKTGAPSTTHTFAGLTLAPGRYAVGIVGTITTLDGATCDITWNGASKANFVSRSGRLSSLYDTNYEDGALIDITEGDAGTFDLVVTMTGGSGTPNLLYVIVRKPDPVTGIIEDAGTNTHSSPESIEVRGKLFTLVSEMYSGTTYVTDNSGKNVEVLASIASERNNRYHYTGSLLYLGAGKILCCLAAAGPTQLYLRLIDTELNALSPEYAVGGVDANLTYAWPVMTADGRVHIMTNGTVDDPASSAGATRCVLNNATRLATEAPDVDFDCVILASTRFQYPKQWKLCTHPVTGDELIIVAWNFYNIDAGTRWHSVASAVLDPNDGPAGKWYAPDGQPADNNDSWGLPETTQARFASAGGFNYWITQLIGATPNPGLNVHIGNTAHQTYGLKDPVVGVVQWPSQGTPKSKIFAMFMEKQSAGENTFGPTTYHYASFDGSGITPQAALPVTLESPNTYRLFADAITTSDQGALIALTERDATNLADALGNQPNIYYDWGTHSKLVFLYLSSVFSASPSVEVVARLTLPLPFNGGWLTWVGSPAVCQLQAAVNMAHGSHAQVKRLLLSGRKYAT